MQTILKYMLNNAKAVRNRYLAVYLCIQNLKYFMALDKAGVVVRAIFFITWGLVYK